MNAAEILALPEMQSMWQQVQKENKDAGQLARAWKRTAKQVCSRLAQRGTPWTAARVHEGMLQMLAYEQQRRFQEALAQ